ncbi:MAG: DUF3341 domain-containing protein [Myxococcales bacterium FL481]|nr:MAG: DUF3341 domain-containing protein [Myxococcales bacterium FL481]
MTDPRKTYGLLAEYESAADIYHACEKVRDAGYRLWDSYTPYPVHGLEKAMGVGPSKVPWITFACGMVGASIGFSAQTWVSAFDYPIIYAGKPFISYQAFVPVTFESGVLLASFGTLFGMLALNGLPRWYHSLFNAPKFARVTDDRFFIAIEARDPKFGDETRALLEATGAVSIEEVER